jgi:hypothetical protein
MGIPSTIYCIIRSSDHNIQLRKSKFNHFLPSVNKSKKSCRKL